MRALIILLGCVVLVEAWKSCPVEDGGGTCPDGNKCCKTDIPGTSSCITIATAAKQNGTGACCSSDTGCGAGYKCANGSYCQLVKPPPAPLTLPLYKLCRVPKESLQLNALTIENTSGLQLAYLSSMGGLEDDSKRIQHKNVTQVFIIVHGSGRTAEDYLCCGMSSIPAGLESSTMVLSPWFLSPNDTAPVGLAGNLLRWNDTGPIAHTWRYGAEATHARISSYETMDRLVKAIMFNKDDRFPNLQRIVVAGHSAGGQFTHRWALTSNSEIWGDSQQGDVVPLRVVAGNPRSFCYLDDRRYTYTNGDLIKPESSRVDKCPGYNAWEWGLGTGGRVPMPKFFEAQIKVSGVASVKERYSKRDVVYLAGKLDILPVRSECEDDDFQGNDRLQRSDRFYRSLQDIFGRRTHRRIVADGIPHDHCLLFQSTAGQEALFGRATESSGEELLNESVDAK